jgi:hypothetical protein
VRTVFGKGRVRSSALMGLAAACLALGLTGCDAATPRVSTSAGLYPVVFQTSVLDYVNRCDPSRPTDVSIDAPSGTTVSVDGSDARSGTFTVPVDQQVGRRFLIEVIIDGTSTTHSVRCLPPDFPQWTADRSGATQSQFYAAGGFGGFNVPSYPIVFDTNGVPVWWLPRSSSYLLAPLPNGNFATLTTEGMTERRLDGTVVRTLENLGGMTDPHDVLLLPNGNYVLATLQPEPCDLSSWGLSEEERCANHVFQELTPEGEVVWAWDTAEHVPVTETAERWRDFFLPSPLDAHDPWHYNSMEHTGDGLIVSFRHVDAVYRIDLASGRIDWKLSGTLRPESLAIVDDPLEGVRAQHDARLLEDGTLTIYDNGSGVPRPPRAVRYRIDPAAGTATLVEQRRDADVPGSFCCGSARMLPEGGWVVGWGGTDRISEYRADGRRVYQLRLGSGFVYRGLPLLPGQYTADQFRAGMDAQYGTG